MDPKSLAKSKRSFTQSHSKKSHHSNQKQASSTGKGSSGNSKKVHDKPSQEKIHLSRDYSPSQPSKQGGFDDILLLNPEGESSTTANVAVRKSSGADYRLLISDAEAMPRVDACFDPFAALDDFLPDFRHGLRSMLSVRNESVSSLINDDVFILDDEATMDHETPCLLSMDLSTLAQRLRKVELSKRLFLDADAPLPYTDTVAETSVWEEADPVGAWKLCESGEDKEKGRSDMSEFNQLHVPSTASWKPVVDLDDGNKNKEKKMLESEAAEAEAELDMLLNSTVSLASPLSSNGGHKEEYHRDAPSEVISGFDAWLDTI